MKKTLGVLKLFQFCSAVYADLEKTLPEILLLIKGETKGLLVITVHFKITYMQNFSYQTYICQQVIKNVAPIKKKNILKATSRGILKC